MVNCSMVYNKNEMLFKVTHIITLLEKKQFYSRCVQLKYDRQRQLRFILNKSAFINYAIICFDIFNLQM